MMVGHDNRKASDRSFLASIHLVSLHFDLCLTVVFGPLTVSCPLARRALKAIAPTPPQPSVHRTGSSCWHWYAPVLSHLTNPRVARSTARSLPIRWKATVHGYVPAEHERLICRNSGSMPTTWPNNKCLRLDIVVFLILSNQRTPKFRRWQRI